MLTPSSGYMAPEYLYRGEISTQLDIYSLGLLIIEITTGERNPRSKDDMSARNLVENVRRKITQLDDLRLEKKIVTSINIPYSNFVGTSKLDNRAHCIQVLFTRCQLPPATESVH